jgi:hypothetical protein
MGIVKWVYGLLAVVGVGRPKSGVVPGVGQTAPKEARLHQQYVVRIPSGRRFGLCLPHPSPPRCSSCRRATNLSVI